MKDIFTQFIDELAKESGQYALCEAVKQGYKVRCEAIKASKDISVEDVQQMLDDGVDLSDYMEDDSEDEDYRRIFINNRSFITCIICIVSLVRISKLLLVWT